MANRDRKRRRIEAADIPFAGDVADPARNVVADFSSDSRALLVLFGGIAGGVSMPVYEFFRVAQGAPAKRLFLRDPRRAWYLRGLPDVGDDAAAVEALLARAVRDSGCTRLVMAGGSAGGFAALRFGARLGADRVLAFSPQTFIDAHRRLDVGDDRWPAQIDPLHVALGPNDPAFDVRVAVAAAGARSRFEVHVSADDPLDLVHADRVRDLPGVTVHQYAEGGHTLVKWMRDTGRLGPVLDDALRGA